MPVLDVSAALLLMAKILLATVSICFLISGCDDGFVDLYHLYLTIRARLGRRPPTRVDTRRISVAALCEQPEQPIAVMIPAWDESAVIRRMLLTNLERAQYSQLHVFVGMYPNDPATQREVDSVRARYPNVHGVVCPNDGPTNKADCLNRLYEAILVFESANDIRFEIFALNDSE